MTLILFLQTNIMKATRLINYTVGRYSSALHSHKGTQLITVYTININTKNFKEIETYTSITLTEAEEEISNHSKCNN